MALSTFTYRYTPLQQHTPLHQGWSMVGYPLQEGANISSWLDELPATIAKDLEDFWQPNVPASNLIRFEPGKGYFIHFETPSTIIWQE